MLWRDTQSFHSIYLILERLNMKYKKTAALILLIIFAIGAVFFGSVQGWGLGDTLPKTPEIAPTPDIQVPAPTPIMPDTTPITPTIIPHAPENREPQASGHFLMREYACDCTGYCDGFPVFMDPFLLERIEALRCALDAPVIITSGVRCPDRNAEVGGIQNSRHQTGHAADLYCPGISVSHLTQTAANLGLYVLPYYDAKYLHVEI